MARSYVVVLPIFSVEGGIEVLGDIDAIECGLLQTLLRSIPVCGLVGILLLHRGRHASLELQFGSSILIFEEEVASVGAEIALCVALQLQINAREQSVSQLVLKIFFDVLVARDRIYLHFASFLVHSQQEFHCKQVFVVD